MEGEDADRGADRGEDREGSVVGAGEGSIPSSSAASDEGLAVISLFSWRGTGEVSLFTGDGGIGGTIPFSVSFSLTVCADNHSSSARITARQSAGHSRSKVSGSQGANWCAGAG